METRNQMIAVLAQISRDTKPSLVNFYMHGSWTGLSQGHTSNAWGFSNKSDAEKYAALLNKSSGLNHSGSKDSYIVTESH